MRLIEITDMLLKKYGYLFEIQFSLIGTEFAGRRLIYYLKYNDALSFQVVYYCKDEIERFTNNDINETDFERIDDAVKPLIIKSDKDMTTLKYMVK